MQCSKSLELLIEKRKNLELLVQIHHNVTNINYNFSYTPRLPDTPTRVDRLLYDVNQERCRVSSNKLINTKLNNYTINNFLRLVQKLICAKVEVNMIASNKFRLN